MQYLPPSLTRWAPLTWKSLGPRSARPKKLNPDSVRVFHIDLGSLRVLRERSQVHIHSGDVNEGRLTVDAAMAEDGIANLGSKDEIEGHRRSVATRTTNVCRDPFNLTGTGFAPSNFFVIRIRLFGIRITDTSLQRGLKLGHPKTRFQLPKVLPGGARRRR